jgi:hypothetical protein
MEIQNTAHTRNVIMGSIIGLVFTYFICPNLFLLPFLAAWKMHMMSTKATMDLWEIVITPANVVGDHIARYHDYLVKTRFWEPTGLLDELTFADPGAPGTW